MSIRPTHKTQACVVIPFPAERLRKFECSYDGEADIHAPAGPAPVPGWWALSFLMASLAMWGWIANRLI